MLRFLRYSVVVLALGACSDDRTGPSGPPEVPTNLVSVSLDGAIALFWDDNAYLADPTGFQNYRIFSTDYDLDAEVCDDAWRLEGTTVAPEFIVAALTNGRPKCFSVSAVNIDQDESARSVPRPDTPRPDARNIVLAARQVQNAGSAFRFWEDRNGDGQVQDDELGLVLAGSDPDADFVIERDGSGALFLTPARPQVTLAVYGNTPVADLTSIDFAPETGYLSSGAEAVPMWGYVFQIAGFPDGFARFGAVRTTHVGEEFLILDWSYQPDPGNPELRLTRRPPA